MDAPQEDYLTDVPYVWGFSPELSPMSLAHVAMLRGFRPVDVHKPFRFLELGCGNGVSTCLLAACFPESEFHGVDVNAEHVQNAARLGREGELTNVTFHERSFGDFAKEDVGVFDLIVLHGVYSWVAPEVRRQIRQIVAHKLRPGGYCYVSYNAMPGWAAMLPLRQMMLDYTAHRGLPVLERARQGLAYVSHLSRNDASYFVNNPRARQKVDDLMRMDINYVAHEFFQRTWTCFYYEEVERDMRECGLAFVGSTPIHLNILELSIPEKLQPLFRSARSALVFEMHKGFVLNEMFRRDLYVKLPASPLDGDVRRTWGDVVFGPRILRHRLSSSVSFPRGEFGYTGEIYSALISILLERAVRFGDLCAAPELASWSAADLLSALHLLCAGRQFGPLLTPLRPRPRGHESWRLASPVNRALLEERLLLQARIDLAAPVVGSGMGVDALGGLSLLALDQAGDEGAEDWAWSFLQRRGRGLMLAGKPEPSQEEQRSLLRRGLESFRVNTLERFAEYGIIEARP